MLFSYFTEKPVWPTRYSHFAGLCSLSLSLGKRVWKETILKWEGCWVGLASVGECQWPKAMKGSDVHEKKAPAGHVDHILQLSYSEHDM